MNEVNKPSAFFTKGQNGEYEYEHEGFIHIHSPVHEEISEGLTLVFLIPACTVRSTPGRGVLDVVLGYSVRLFQWKCIRYRRHYVRSRLRLLLDKYAHRTAVRNATGFVRDKG